MMPMDASTALLIQVLHERIHARNRYIRELESRNAALSECVRSANGAFIGIMGESQFCNECHAFERAQEWRNEWHGGDRVLSASA